MSNVSPAADPQHLPEPTRAGIESRLATLRSEYARGEIEVQRVQTRLTELQQTMLRLSGAITVLEEFLAVPGPASSVADEAPIPGQALLNAVPESPAPCQ